ncbi:MAG: phosphoribosyl-ATP diphosphatase [Lautropia sp.]|nr:phosphoribosyl-ATP diphosphatase [Lautropia sp.]
MTDQSSVSPSSSDDTLRRLAEVIAGRRGADPGRSYVASLLAGGDERILKKVGEEATEVVIAAMDGEKSRVVAETADLWFHTLVMLVHHELRPDDVLAELRRREGLSGIDEKAQRPGNC